MTPEEAESLLDSLWTLSEMVLGLAANASIALEDDDASQEDRISEGCGWLKAAKEALCSWEPPR